MSQVTEFSERFADVLSGLLFDLLKAAGVTYHPVKSQERIRDTGRRMALSIEFHAERKAIEVAQKLQTETVKAFDAMEKEVSELRKAVEGLTLLVTRMQKAEVKRLKKQEQKQR